MLGLKLLPFFFGRRHLPFGWSPDLRLTRGPAGNRTTTGSLSATQECRNTNWATRTPWFETSSMVSATFHDFFFLSFAFSALARSSHSICANERIKRCISQRPALGSQKGARTIIQSRIHAGVQTKSQKHKTKQTATPNTKQNKSHPVQWTCSVKTGSYKQ